MTVEATGIGEEARLADAIALAAPLPGTGYREEVLERLDRCRRIYERKLAPTARVPELPALLVVAGGTNVGKTSIANAITGARLGAPTPIARGTKAAVCYIHERAAAAVEATPWLTGYALRPLAAMEDANREPEEGAPTIFLVRHADEALQSLAVADTPDVDSVLARNLRVAEDLLFAADAVLYVTSEEKYNDEACVAFLRVACSHGKRVLVALNKHESAEALDDLRQSVVPEAAASAPEGGAEVTVTALPFRPAAGREAAMAEACAGLRADVLALAREPDALKARARTGAARALEAAAAPALQRLREEATLVSGYRDAVRAAADEAADGYRADLQDVEVIEFKRVFQILADALRVPVIDDVYDGVRSAMVPVTGRLRGLLGMRDPEAAERALLDARDREDLERARLRLGEALTRVRALPGRYPAEVREPLRAALLPSTEAGPLFELQGGYLASLRETADAWVDEVQKDLQQRLRDQPGLYNMLRGVKGVLRAGGAGAGIMLTGGLGLEDAVIAPAIDQIVSRTYQKGVDRAYFQRRRAEFHDRRAAVRRARVRERAEALALARLPAGAGPEAIERLEAALAAAARP